jgi:UDP-N-acetylmuramyl pentapeptide synthase
MKAFFKLIIGTILTSKAKRFLREHHVQVIGVTGSIGKTSTKEAIYTVLKKKFNVHSSQKSFNTEFGLSLAVLQEEESGFTSPVAWLKILRRVLFEKKEPYQKIVLEMGADKPGDLKKLMKIAPPKISVVTNVNPVHLAEGQFKNLEAIAHEKATLVRHLPKEGVAVLNFDDDHVREMETPALKFSYAVNHVAMLMAGDVRATAKDIRFTVAFENKTADFVVPVIGSFQIYVLLPAIAVGLQMGMDLHDIAEALKEFHLPAGRMNPIEGVNGAQIIDGSYNASPMTMETALELLNELKAERKIAALGMMNELGELSYESHIRIGEKAAQVADIIVAVGKEAPIYKKGAMEMGMKESAIYTFFDSEEAGEWLKDQLKKGDLVLVKGSQNRVQMERLVKLIMKKPEQAELLLCRQGLAWQK